MPPYDVENYFDDVNDKRIAYWLGFLFAEGCIDYEPNKSWFRIRVGLANLDENHLKKLKDLISPLKPIYYRKGKEACSFEINNRRLVTNLKNYGLVSCTESNINFIYEYPSVINHFIRGYFDGDGTVGIYQIPDKRVSQHYMGTTCQLRISTTNKNTSIILNELLSQFNAKIVTEKAREVYHISINRIDDKIKFIPWLYENSDNSIRLERKYDKNMEIMELYRNRF